MPQFITLVENLGLSKQDYLVISKPGSNDQIVRTNNAAVKMLLENHLEGQKLENKEWAQIWNDQQKSNYTPYGNPSFFNLTF